MSRRPDELTDVRLFDLRTEPADQRARERLLRELYETLYVESFTIPSEREDPSIWEPRLWGDGALELPLELHVLVAARPAGRGAWRFYGACFSELYHWSGCGLVTYLMVDRQYRQAGLGRRLLNESLALLQARAEAPELQQRRSERAGPALLAAFAESNDPARVEDDVMDPRQRLEAFGRLGARQVDIPYVQPELAPGQGRCHDLLLLALPLAGRPLERLAAGAVLDFLDDFYRANGVERPADDPDFLRMASAIERLAAGRPDLPLRLPTASRPGPGP